MSIKQWLPLVLVCGCSEHGQTPEPFGVPITGGTVMVTRDGGRAVVADPDRDRLVQIELVGETVVAETALEPGDEPGRIVEDAAGRVHVALRRGGALLTVDATGAILDRRPACPEPRGLAYDQATDQIHVACTGGELVSFAAAGGAAVRSLRIDRDLRDVVVRGAQLVVTRFHSAEILTLDETGTVVERVMPPEVFRSDGGFGGDFGAPGGGQGQGDSLGVFSAAASTAWRTIAMPDGRLVMSHQRRAKGVLDADQPGGYGGNCGGGPIEDAVSVVTPGQAPQAVARIGRGALPVDLAVSRAGDLLAVVTAGDRKVTVVSSSIALGTPDDDRCEPPPESCDGPEPVPPDDGTVPESNQGMPATCCDDEDRDGVCDDSPDAEDKRGARARLGPPTSVAWTADGDLLIFYPEASALVVREAGGSVERRIDLPGAPRNDAGRNVFHAQTRIGVSCASCHPEGRDDGLVWDFAREGQRRTQSLAGSLLERAPFHWTGEEASLPALLDDVFVQRMSGGVLTANEKVALGAWLDRIPAPAPTVTDPAAVARGAAIFEEPAVGCVSCHNGALMTNNLLFDVGTGGKFKVPSLLGVGARPPFLHDGCAATLMERFGPCAGGPGAHGDTSMLSPAQLEDLVHYLDSL